MTTEPRPEAAQKAYAILVVGAAIGVLCFLGFFVSSWYWWAPLVVWLREGTTDDLQKFVIAEVVLFTGLGIMFVAFQSARKFERVDPTLRRVLYGYNAFLQLFLVGKGLALIVVFCNIRYPMPFDTTAGGFYSLDEATKKYVASLDKPVEVYMVMDGRDPAYADMVTVLTEMRNVNPRYFHYEDVAPTSGNSARLQDISKRFKKLTREGLIVAYGDKPENNSSFIASGELTNEDYGNSADPRRQFNGEVRLLQELMFLAADQKRPVVYVTQGHGEPTLHDDRGEKGLGQLVRLLGEANFDVRPLTATSLDPKQNSVPADADVVMVIGPQRPMSDIIPGLEKWMNPTEPGAKKGRLVAMLGPTEASEGVAGNPMRDTGMEEFLRNYAVDVTKEQIWMLYYPLPNGNLVSDRDPANVVVSVSNPDETRHPLALMVKGRGAQRWRDVRHVAAFPGAANFQAEPIMETRCLAWTETDMKAPVSATLSRLLNDDNEVAKRIKREMMPVMLAVSESAANANPHSSNQPNEGRTPRMVVFGCSSLATNPYLRDATSPNFELIRGSLDWTREHYSNIGVEPKSYKFFRLPVLTSFWNLFYLPVAALLLTVAGLGLIVWNVRRS